VNNCSQKASHIAKDVSWTFDFSVPFHQGRVINVHQSATDHGVVLIQKNGDDEVEALFTIECSLVYD